MWEEIRANRRRAAVLVAVMAALLMAVGYAFGEVLAPGAGPLGLALGVVLWAVMAAVAYSSGDRVVLALSRARKISPADHPVLHNVVEEMRIASGLSRVPDIYIIDEAAPNAFATGRSPETASVAVTAGLLERLDRNQLQGVIGHELGHVVNRDVLYVTMVGVMMGAIVLLADVASRVLFYGGGRRRTSRSSGGGQAQAILLAVALVLIILAPLVAQLVYFALSRRREYLADACSAQFTRNPESLASALETIAAAPEKLAVASRATAPMFIVDPLATAAQRLSALTATHPPTRERVKILRSMAGGAVRDYDEAYKQVTGRPVGVVPFGDAPRAVAPSQASGLRAPAVAAVLGGGTIAVASTATTAPTESHLSRVRQTTDALWRLNGYAFVDCPCGTTLKFPPEYLGRRIACPHCGRVHEVAASPARETV